MNQFGIDISKWQKGFNFDKAVAEGVEFVILRGAYHLTKDTCFEDFYAECKRRELPVGVYHYSMAKTVAEAKAEADFLIDHVLKGKRFEYPVYMDIEDKVQQALGKDLLTDIVITFCDALEAAGYYAGIYSTAYFLSDYTHTEKLSRFDKWIAQWNSACTYTGAYGMWQFGGETNYIRSNKIAGVICDQDYAYKDYPAVMKALGLNGYGKTQAGISSLEMFIREVQAACGAKIDGIAGPETLRKTITVSAGKNRYHAVVEAVQKRLAALGYHEVGQVDGIAGVKFTAAVMRFQSEHGCWVDGELTARNKSWRILLGMEAGA